MVRGSPIAGPVADRGRSLRANSSCLWYSRAYTQLAQSRHCKKHSPKPIYATTLRHNGMHTCAFPQQPFDRQPVESKSKLILQATLSLLTTSPPPKPNLYVEAAVAAIYNVWAWSAVVY